MSERTQRVGARLVTSLVAALLAAGCGGPMETPTQVVDLMEDPTALENAFDVVVCHVDGISNLP